jgi:hypothetical protein
MASVAESRRRSGQAPALHTRDNRVIIDKAKPQSGTTPQVNQPQQQDQQEEQAAPQSDQPQKPPELKKRPPQL